MVTKSKAGKESSRIKVGKLKVNKETVKDLTTAELKQVKGGWIRPPITWTCPQPSGACTRP